MTQYAEFLGKAGWAEAAISPLAGDASNRRYVRVLLGGRHAVLMDAAPERGEDTAPFLKIAAHLRSAGLHAPQIYAIDRDRGLILLEDLGDGLYAKIFQAEPERQNRLYTRAIDVLLRLHATPLPAPETPDYTAIPMAEASKLAPIWYAGRPDDAASVGNAMQTALDTLDWADPVLVLRDYHAENLIWIAQADGLDQVGLLDFQDAAIGHPVYDVISIIQDARRDVPEPVAQAMVAHYCAGSGMDRTEFAHAAAVLGAQRALRILGVFARLSLHFGKADYIDLIPRVWNQLEDNLAHPALAKLASVVRACLPPPSDAHLQDLKDRVSTCPHL